MTVNWKKSLIVVIDIIIGAYLVIAVTAFNKPESPSKECSEVRISIEEDLIGGFLDAGEIRKILERDRLYPLAQPMDFIDVRIIEDDLQKSPFIEKAECYKTLDGHVIIKVKQRMPVIKVLADNGDSYYVDTHGAIMPETRFVTDLMIATGSVSKKYAQRQLVSVANLITKDRFWKNEVVQLNVLPNGTMELVPRVGNHIVFLGPPTDIEKKLERLRKFYVYGLNKAGWNKYSYVSVEFGNQIICKKR